MLKFALMVRRLESRRPDHLPLQMRLLGNLGPKRDFCSERYYENVRKRSQHNRPIPLDKIKEELAVLSKEVQALIEDNEITSV